MTYDPSQDPHAYVYVLKDGIRFPFRIESKGFLKKKLKLIDYPDTIELINEGIRKYGEKYVGTFDCFNFDKPKPIRLFSKCSYDELVKLYRWRHEFDKDRTTDYDTAIVFGVKLSELSILKRKLEHVISELTVMYPSAKNPSDSDFDINMPDKIRIGPPSELIGPDGKPLGDLKQRLIYDRILYSLHYYYWSDNKKIKKKGKLELIEFIKSQENITKLPELKIHELNEIISEL